MFRRDRWWIREIERVNRAHADERALLIATLARLAGTRAPNDDLPAEFEPEPDTGDFDPYNPDLG